MLQYRDIKTALQDLCIERSDPTIVYASSQLIPQVRGGAQTILGAILGSIDNILMPSFTYRTMVIPEFGPPDNLINYGSGRISNLDAAIFTPELPADFADSQISEIFRNYPDVSRSAHPIFSFLGLGLDSALISQTISDPYGHIRFLQGKDAKIVLLAKDPSALFSLHFCEQVSGRKQFVRWAITQDGIKECPHFPGCPRGFHKILYQLDADMKKTQIVGDPCYSVSLDHLVSTAVALLSTDPYALLCNDLHCEKCNAIRRDIRQKVG
ncbi:MAG TPA: hypothetical protein DCK95_00735 [Anaerolineaceae bacterium]|nr:hypothetical protein [Anaerolineaceae bacterium]